MTQRGLLTRMFWREGKGTSLVWVCGFAGGKEEIVAKYGRMWTDEQRLGARMVCFFTTPTAIVNPPSMDDVQMEAERIVHAMEPHRRQGQKWVCLVKACRFV